MIKPVIVSIAKFEKDYIEEFVRYHLNIGFEQIYLFDNEDIPTYQGILKEFGDKVIINHLPGKHYLRLPQYEALQIFINNYMWKPEITHVAHLDIDEFIVLKKHNNIKDFIKEYIFDGENGIMCGGIGINWRFFGNNNHVEKTKVPNTIRFTKRQQDGNLHVKTLFNKQFYGYYTNPHNIVVTDNNYPIKCTNGNIIDGPFNENMDFSVIQLNHYKCKTWKEFKYVR